MTKPLARVLAVVAACCCLGAADLQTDVDNSRRNAIVSAIEKVAPAVCSINVVQLESEMPLDPFTSGLFNFLDLPRHRPRLRGRQIKSVGSGFLIDAEGHVLTNFHVIEDAAAVSSITLPDGRDIEVAYVGGDERSDLAVLRAKETNLPYVTLGDSDDVLIGEWAIAIGNPFGVLMTDPQPTVSVGIVSANHRRVSRSIGEGKRLYQDLIQTDAAINPGNSGGPLVNAAGQTIGINTMIFSESGGLGFALPINRMRRVANEIIAYGRRRDPWPGFVAEDLRALDPGSAARLEIRAESGCVVSSIRDDCPAYEAGLRPGDVITAVNGQPVTYPVEIDFIFWSLFVGDRVTLEVESHGKPLTIEFTVAELGK